MHAAAAAHPHGVRASSATPVEKKSKSGQSTSAVGLVSGERASSGLRRTNRSGAVARRVPSGLRSGQLRACGTYQRQGVGRVGRSGRRRAVGVPVLADSAMPNSRRVGLSGRCVGAAERPVVAWRAAPTLPTARRHDARRGDRAGASVGADVAEHGRSAEPRGRSAWAVRGKRAARSAAWTRPRRIRGPASWGSRAPGAGYP